MRRAWELALADISYFALCRDLSMNMKRPVISTKKRLTKKEQRIIIGKMIERLVSLLVELPAVDIPASKILKCRDINPTERSDVGPIA